MTEKTYKYWLKSADLDLQTARNLFQSGEYPWALFVGHLTIEKLFKAYHAKFIDPKVPYRHSLVLLAQKCKMNLPESEIDFLDELSSFNIAARYPDSKFQFYKKCTMTFTRKYLGKIEELAQRLKEHIAHEK
ncbi:MAG: HEPN domain-containing protein [Phycisphaerae bacterium]